MNFEIIGPSILKFAYVIETSEAFQLLGGL